MISDIALERTNVEDDKPEGEDNAQTIRPKRSPGLKAVPLAQPPSSNIVPIVEDYSDVAEEDEVQLQEKVADFKVTKTFCYITLRSQPWNRLRTPCGRDSSTQTT
jgi:hypothetical protein